MPQPLILIVKFPLCLFYLVSFIVVSWTARLFIRGEQARCAFHQRMMNRYAEKGPRLFSVRLTVTGRQNLPASGGCLLACNHLSYLDIALIGSLRPMQFITSDDLRRTPFLGAIALYGASVFVNRRSIAGLREDVTRIAGTIRDGSTVCLFPEATSGDGAGVLRFKRGLMETAVKAQRPIVPMCLKYTRINGKQPDRRLLDRVCYYGDMVFVPHLMRLLLLRSIDAELTIFPAVETAGTTSEEIAPGVYETVAGTYGNPLGSGDSDGNAIIHP